MKGPEKLRQCEDRWQTRMGAAMLQERAIFRGKDLHKELADWSWLELYLYGITGRTFDETELKILNAMWVFTSYPDPRIWNNRIAGLCGTARSSGALGVAAALAVSDADIYGGQPLVKAIGFLKSVLQLVHKGVPVREPILNELEKHRKIPGFGRPHARVDERIEPMLNYLKMVGYDAGEYVNLVFDVEKFLLESRRRIRLNYAGFVAAICADLGLSERETYLYVMLGFTAGMVPCYLDGLIHAEGTLFPLRCERIDYLGPDTRSWE